LFQRLVMHRVRRFLSTFALDVLRAVAASAIGAFIVTHQWTQTQIQAQTQAPAATPPVTEQPVTQMVRDEHAAMGDYLKDEEAKERLALEKSRQDAKIARAEPRSDVDSHKPSVRPPATHPSAEVQKGVAQANVPLAPAQSVGGAPMDGSTTTKIEPANRGNTTTIVAPITPVPAATPGSDAIVATTLPPPPPAPDVPADVVKPAAPPQQSLADKAVAITHINDVIAFAHRFVGLFHFEEAPVPPADVRTNRFDG
jgi:hypothetical protein